MHSCARSIKRVVWLETKIESLSRYVLYVDTKMFWGFGDLLKREFHQAPLNWKKDTKIDMMTSVVKAKPNNVAYE